jgi:hypothetical protein
MAGCVLSRDGWPSGGVAVVAVALGVDCGRLSIGPRERPRDNGGSLEQGVCDDAAGCK